MQRYRDLVSQFEEAKATEQVQCTSLKTCVECGVNPAKIYCDDCGDFFCHPDQGVSCFEKLHARGRRMFHNRTWVELDFCAECGETLSKYFCWQCRDPFCAECFASNHQKGGRRNHIPIVLRSWNQTQFQNPATATFNHGNIHPGQIAVLSSS